MELIKNESGYKLNFRIEELDCFTISDLKQLIDAAIPGVSEVSFTGIEDNSLLKEQLASTDLLNQPDSPFPACFVLTGEIKLTNTAKKDQIKIEIHSLDMLNALSNGVDSSPRLARLCDKFLSLNVLEDDISANVKTKIKWDEHSITIGQGFVHKFMGYGSIPPVLDKLAYIFHKLEIGVIKETGPIGSQDRTSLIYEGSTAIARNTETKNLSLSPFALFKLFPSLSNRYTPGNKSANEIKDINKLDQIKVLCANYLGHIWDVRQSSSKPHGLADLQAKEVIIKNLYYAKDLNEAKTILSTADNQTILNKNRTPIAYLLLKTLGVLLSLPISVPVIFYYGLKGEFNFFTPASKLLADKANLIIDNSNISSASVLARCG